MTSKQIEPFESILGRALENLEKLDSLNAHEWGFGEEKSWHFSQESGVMSLEFDDGRVVNLDCTVIGSWDTRQASWLWAWGNESIKTSLKSAALAAKKFGETCGYEFLVHPRWECDEDFAIELASIAILHSKLHGLSVARLGETDLFLGITKPAVCIPIAKDHSCLNGDSIQECKLVVQNFATELNKWEIIEYILDRVKHQRTVPPARLKLIENKNCEDHFREHKAIFNKYVYLKNRKSGSLPGKPTSISRDGSFTNVSIDRITSAKYINNGNIELEANWGYMHDGGQLKFVLTKSDRWLIHSLYCRDSVDDDWIECDF